MIADLPMLFFPPSLTCYTLKEELTDNLLIDPSIAYLLKVSQEHFLFAFAILSNGYYRNVIQLQF